MNKEDYFKYYIQGSDHYLIPKDVFIELFNEMSNWREEVKELNKKYLNAVADYETTMAEKEQLNSLVNSCQEEIRRLKKQLEDTNEELELVRCDLHNRTSERNGYYRNIEILENQQKEFINYLEDLIKQNETVVEVSKYGLPKNCSKLLIDFYKEILSKYQEIIGG